MKISVKTKPNFKKDSIEKIGENEFLAATKAPAVDNKANKAVIKIVAGYFNIAPSRIKIIAGLKSKKKILEIN